MNNLDNCMNKSCSKCEHFNHSYCICKLSNITTYDFGCCDKFSGV